MPVISEQLKPIDTVNGFQIRPGFFREFGAVAIPGGVGKECKIGRAHV